MDMPVGETDYKKQQETIRKSIDAAASKTPTKILESTSQELDTEKKDKNKMNCDIAEKLFHEGLSMYRKGDLTFSEFVEDLYRSLKPFAKKKD